ncbi:hypothetical protein SCP_1203240 [Sparassis crispa]|uniref:Protein kinase domain-containing protein n=1 Tax=Sparassis crispa TaxID=139825 RepID=A0A401H0Z4_9APHY|nr:hypothetical protein SCP_1203240 [Sparassis crispa]GBE88095.1 hypothetical protein SCP_1203240 [Sparassis crispa]
MRLLVTFFPDIELMPFELSDDYTDSSVVLSVAVIGDPHFKPILPASDDEDDEGGYSGSSESDHYAVDSEDEDENVLHSDYATIYRGIMTRNDTGTCTDVVLKCSYRNRHADIVEEGSFYVNQLKPLQGDAVPECYCLFRGTGPKGYEIVCIVLEDCGKTVGSPFATLPLLDRTRILSQLVKIHYAGVMHRDVHEGHVVERGGIFKIIDFHDAVGHEPACDFRFADDLHAGEPEPDGDEAGCIPLWRQCKEFEIWDDGRIFIPLSGMAFRRCNGWPRQEVIDKLMPSCISHWNTIVKHALQEYFHLIQKELDNGVSMELLKKNANERFLKSLRPADVVPNFVFPQYRRT